MRCGGSDALVRSQMEQPYGSADNEPHDTHSVWFTVAVTVLLSGEQLDVALKDTSGGVVSTDTALNAIDATSLVTPHRASTSATDADSDAELAWLDATVYENVYVPLPKSTALDVTFTPFIVHNAAAARPGSSPSARTITVSVAPAPKTPDGGSSRTDAMPGVSRTTISGIKGDDTLDSRRPDSAACVDLL
jgi:hypothetical protein